MNHQRTFLIGYLQAGNIGSDGQLDVVREGDSSAALVTEDLDGHLVVLD